MPRDSVSDPTLRCTLLGAALAALLVPHAVVGQSRACRFVAPTRTSQVIRLAGGGTLAYVGAPHIVCDDGVRIQADSAVASSMQNMSHLMGNVWYRDGSRELRSDEARYFSRQGRLQAHGSVFLQDTIRGSEIRNGDLVYLRQTDFRDEEEITVTRNVSEGVRPVALLFMRPAADTVQAADSTAAVEDSAAVAQDTAAAVADSMGVTPDTVAATPDTLVAPRDTLVALLDTVPEPPDSLVRADSLGVLPDTLGVAVADSAAAVPDTAPPRMEPADRLEAVTPIADSLAADQPSDTTPPVPYEVVGDRLFLQGDRFFQAVGRVEIERDSLLAFSDTARYDQEEGTLELRGSARVEGSGYDLAGRDVQLAVPGGEVRRVRAVREGVLTGDRLRLVAPVIDLFLLDGAMERLVAVPLRFDPESGDEPSDSADLARPVATAEEFRLEADSVEVLAPAQVLDRINAVGGARGESTSRDSLNVEGLPEAARRDWLEGDTVVAVFVRAEPQEEPPDTAAEQYVLERLVARGSARSLYRLLPSDSASRPGVDSPAVHYVTGSTIVIVMGDGDVDHMEVEGPTRGWHLEPTVRVAEDTTQVRDTLRPDTLPPDTASVRPGGGATRLPRVWAPWSDSAEPPFPAQAAHPSGRDRFRRRRSRR
jgi:lipopolysaccharide export system protein LptA